MDDGVLIDDVRKTVIAAPMTRTKETYVIPKGMKTLGYYCFYGNLYIKEVTIPDGIEWVEPHFFGNCANLETVKFYGTRQPPAEGTTYVFKGTTSVKNVLVPENYSGTTFYHIQVNKTLSAVI